jgi:hypothetical protein
MNRAVASVTLSGLATPIRSLRNQVCPRFSVTPP